MKKIILLHGALGAADQLAPLADELMANGFHVFTFNLSGHGQKHFASDFSIDTFASELKRFTLNNNLEQPHIFGYSMGGFISLYLAKREAKLLGNIITLGTKFKWTKEIAEKEIMALNPEVILQKVPAFAKALETRHGAGWKTLLHKTAGMLLHMGENNPLQPGDFDPIENKVTLGLADGDKMVTLEETREVFDKLKNVNMYMLPNAKHPIETVNTKLLAQVIIESTNIRSEKK